jgi:group I intron endonuclease
MYIYKFTHIASGRCYIGQTVQDPNQRRLEHICCSNKSPKSYHFHNALNLYGVAAFLFEVIDTATTIEELNFLEEKYVEQFDSINNGFNIRQPGGNKLHSEESKERMRQAQRAAHARRKAEGKDGGWKRKDGGPMKGKSHPIKGKSNANKGLLKGKTWEEIYGVEGAQKRRLAHKLKSTKLNVEEQI